MPSITSRPWVLNDGTATDHPNPKTLPTTTNNPSRRMPFKASRAQAERWNGNRPNNPELSARRNQTCSLTQTLKEERSHTTRGAERWNGNRNAASRARVMSGRTGAAQEILISFRPPQPRCCWSASVTRMTMPLPSTCPCQPTQPPVPGCRTVKCQQPHSLPLRGAERLNGNRPNNRKHISPAHLACSRPETVTKMTPPE